MTWLCKTKIWWKKKTVLYRHRKFPCTHKTGDIYKDCADDVETMFQTSNYELNRQLHKRKNEIVIGVMNDKFGRKITKKTVKLTAETYSYLIDDGSEDKKAKTTKSVS